MAAQKEDNIEGKANNIQSENAEKITISVGKIFCEARQEKGFSLDDIVKELNIRKSYITAIESDNFDKLPSGIYKRTYIKSYASVLDLDSSVLLEQLYGEVADNDNKIAIKNIKQSDCSSPGKKIILFSIILVVIVYSSWHYLNNYDDSKGIGINELFAKKDKVLDGEITSKAITDNAINGNNIKTANTEIDHIEKVLSSYAVKNPTISILAIENANLEIIGSNGEVLISKAMQAGEVYFVPKSENNIKFKSNISSFELFVDGNFVDSIDSLEKTDDGIMLNSKQLLSLVAIQ